MSEHVANAKNQSLDRLAHQRRQLAPFRFFVVAIVIVTTLTARPSAGVTGKGLAVSLTLVVFSLGFLSWPSGTQPLVRPATRGLQLLVVGAAGVVLAVLQPNGAPELAASAAVFVAGTGLPTRWALWFGAAVTVGLAVALGAADATGETVLSCVVLCGVLGVTGALLRRSRESQDQTELLLAQLHEARDDQARAAALNERASIARDLHDVLAHSLSGLSIQLEGARRLATLDDVSDDMRATIDRAATLAKQGLVEARDAVSALRQDASMTIDQLESQVAHFRDDLGLDVTYEVTGSPRPVTSDVALVLHRVLGEALTNVARHAPAAATRVTVAWEVSSIRLLVHDDGAAVASTSGGGWGIVGVRERVERLGGHLRVGPTVGGWTLDAQVPA